LIIDRPSDLNKLTVGYSNHAVIKITL